MAALFQGITGRECLEVAEPRLLLVRNFGECPEDGVYPGLIARALGLEPLQYVCVDTQGDRSLRRNRLEAFSHDSADDVLYVCLRMFRGQQNVLVLHRPEATKVGLRLFRGGLPFHVS